MTTKTEERVHDCTMDVDGFCHGCEAIVILKEQEENSEAINRDMTFGTIESEVRQALDKYGPEAVAEAIRKGADGAKRITSWGWTNSRILGHDLLK